MVRIAPLLAAFGLAACASTPPPVCPPPPAPPAPDRAGVDAFNRAMIDATLRMDTPALIALWEEDGVSLLPGAPPLEGRTAIGAFIAHAVAQFPGAKMRSFEMPCSGIEIHGDVATEWCDEHQIVDLGPDKPPFDGRGKLLYVLHRGADGHFRLRREMWNEGAAAK